jgi:tetratricopeptide (TPR) repeat protein
MSIACAQRDERTAPIGSGKSLIFGVLLALMLLLFTAGLAEITLRLVGRGPLRVKPFDVRVEPGGSLFIVDPLLGYRMRPGRFQVRMQSGYTFYLTNNSQGSRISETDDRLPEQDDRPELWLLGCSFTFGYGVDDQDSIAWRLQAAMPQYDIVNYGVPGYGTAQALVQLREAFRAGRRPRAAILLYVDVHDIRNTLLREGRRVLWQFSRLGPMQHPYVRLKPDGLRVITSDQLYRPFPLASRSAAVNAIEELYNRWEAMRVDSHETTKALFTNLGKVCAAEHVPLVVAGLNQSAETEDTLAHCRRQGIAAFSISFDTTNQENGNWPADPTHPSPLGYARLAANLMSKLRLQALRADYDGWLKNQATAFAAHVDLATAQLRECQRAREMGWRDVPPRTAIEHLRIASGLMPDDKRCHLLLASAFELDGDQRLAIEHYRQAVGSEGKVGRLACLRLAWILATTSDASLRRPDEALTHAQRGATDAIDPESLEVMAAAQASTGRFQDAIETATRALELATRARRCSLAKEIERQLTHYRRGEPLATSQRDSSSAWPYL